MRFVHSFVIVQRHLEVVFMSHEKTLFVDLKGFSLHKWILSHIDIGFVGIHKASYQRGVFRPVLQFFLGLFFGFLFPFLLLFLLFFDHPFVVDIQSPFY